MASAPLRAPRRAKKDLPVVLFVDDEKQIIDSITVLMRREFNVIGATNAAEGLNLLDARPDVEVVVSDMRMPGIDGATFLAQVRQAHPQVVRLLLTGQTDLPGAIKAVNEGQIFRFLTKPFQSSLLAESLAAAVQQHRLAVAEKELLEQTLRGAIEVLHDVLSLALPQAFGRVARLKKYATRLAERLQVTVGWDFEVALMLSQLGWIAVPDESLRRILEGEALSEEEQQMVQRVPALAHQLLQHLPRIDTVLEILSGLSARSHRPERVPMAAKIIRVVDDFDRALAGVKDEGRAFDALLERDEARYSQAVLTALEADLTRIENERRKVVVGERTLAELEPGMVLAYEIRTHTGGVFVARGFEVTESFLERAKNLRPGTLCEPIYVIEGG